jgi:REP element-mobilizing transposase RayT
MLLIKEYQKVYNFKVYAYCLMDNHIHLILDPNGADISKIMHCINFKYARYFNAEHKRHGHLFQDRFKSRVVVNNRYLLALSSYIHNNPLDVKGYESNPEDYYYSSLAVYFGQGKDEFNIIDEELILSFFDNDMNKARARYKAFVLKTKSLSIDTLEDIKVEEIEFVEEKSEYRSERKILIRNYTIDAVVKYVVEIFNVEKALLHVKYQKDTIPIRGILALLLRNLCNASGKDICNLLGNITSSRVSKLSRIGLDLVSNDDKYKNIINDFIELYS